MRCFIQFFVYEHYFADLGLCRRPKEHDIVYFVRVLDVALLVTILIDNVNTFLVELRTYLFTAQGHVLILIGVNLVKYFVYVFTLLVRFCPFEKFLYPLSLLFVGL